MDDDRRPWFELAFGEHYPLLYGHRDDEEARLCMDRLQGLRCLGNGPVLDLGCGAGRHLRLLAELGLAAIGLDLSMPLLSKARTAASIIALVRADMRRLPFRHETFSSVLSLFTAFGYFGAAWEHEPMVRDIARVLRPGGHWILDFLDSERVAAELRHGPVVSCRDLGPLRAHEVRRLAFRPRRVIKTVRLESAPGNLERAHAHGIGPEGLRYTEEVTLLSLQELESLGAAAGLHPIAGLGGYDGRPLVPGASERWLLIYRNEQEEG